MAKNPIPQKVLNLASAIINLITTHEGKTSSSTQKGHAYAGGAPQSIGTSLSAGTDNGYYARADHVHTVDYSNILNKPSTFAPSAHNHDTTYYTKGEVDSLLNNILLDRIFLDEYGNLVIGTTINGMLLTGNKNIVQSNETSTLTATAYDAYSDIVQDKPLQLYKDNVLVGIYNTDENGQITYTYTGNGSGKHSFYVQNGRFQSEPFVVWDTYQYDNGNDSTHNIWDTPYQCTLTYGSEYAEISESTEYGFIRSATAFPKDCTIEFDYYNHDGASASNIFQIQTSANAYVTVIAMQYLGLSSGNWYHLKMTIEDGVLKVYKDNATTPVYTYPSSGSMSIATDTIKFLIMTSGATTKVRFKNLKIYPV